MTTNDQHAPDDPRQPSEPNPASGPERPDAAAEPRKPSAPEKPSAPGSAEAPVVVRSAGGPPATTPPPAAPAMASAAQERSAVSEPFAPPPPAAAPAPPTDPAHGGTPRRGLRWLLRLAGRAAVLLGVGVGLLVLLGLAQRGGWLTAGVASEAAAEASREAGETRYICPMMCTPPSSEPGRCPVCGMELVPASGGGGGGGDGKSVTIEPAARRLVGIRTATASAGRVERTVRTIGAIEYDESRLATISAYVDGRLEKMYADYVGVPVRKGDDLALLYSPQLYSAQVEYLSSLDRPALRRLSGSGDTNRLAEMARENLIELGMTEEQIEELRRSGTAQSRIRIKAPQGGTVIEKRKVEGDYVKTGETVYRIADLSTVWLMLDLFPEDAAAVRFGQPVEAEVHSMPGEVVTGRVAFIDPTVNRNTRTVRVRVELVNADRRLRPGDYATARIRVPAIPQRMTYDPALAGKYISPMHPQIIRDAPGECPRCGMELVPTTELGYAREPLPEPEIVTVPRNAVLMAGGNSVLYVETDPGRFEIRRVVVGPLTEKEAVIVEGLAAGEKVATDGNFLIDSQMQLSGNPSLLEPGRAPRYPPGPLELRRQEPELLTGEAGKQFDQAYEAYFEIQTALAADTTPRPEAVDALHAGLSQLIAMPEVPEAVQRHFGRARRSAARLDRALEDARDGFRSVSHAMLRAAALVRGPKTRTGITHFYCSMVPGGGGDWMQPGGKLANPYWGSEMLRCGERLASLEPDEEMRNK